MSGRHLWSIPLPEWLPCDSQQGLGTSLVCSSTLSLDTPVEYGDKSRRAIEGDFE